MNVPELRAYASTFATYLVSRLGNQLASVQKIILYGSVARGDAASRSDIDLFIDTKNKKMERLVKNITEEFLESREAAIFQARGISNELSVKVGDLKKWKELHRSIMATGIILWGRYQPESAPSGAQAKIIFFWDKIQRNRGAFLNKVYGFTSRGKNYPGLLRQCNGSKVGKSCILIPQQHQEEFIPLFKKYGVSVRKLEVLVNE